MRGVSIEERSVILAHYIIESKIRLEEQLKNLELVKVRFTKILQRD